MKSILCCALVLLAGAASAQAGDCCDCCGCDASCCKVCRCVPSTKKVTKPVYDCECEDFCVPGPSIRTVCHDECGKKKIIYTPTCATMRTRKKLVTTEKTKTVPTTKWVVENLCPKCSSQKTSDPAPDEDMVDDRAPSANFSPLAVTDDVDAEDENSRGGGITSRVRSDLARVLSPFVRQK